MAVVETTFRAMASHVQVIVVDGHDQAGLEAQRVVSELESVWSRFVPTSDVTRLNNANGQPVTVHPATVRLIDTMIEAIDLGGGRFAPTILPDLMRAGYVASIDNRAAVTVVGEQVRSTEQIKHHLGDAQIDRHQHVVALPPGLTIDPGGVGKGLAADLVVAELRGQGSAGALVSIGGDLAAAGDEPPQGWQLDIEDHFDKDKTLVSLAFSGGGVATSNTLGRRWIDTTTGQEQHHLIDPCTTQPSISDIVAATVVGSCGWQAEVHAKGVLLGGTEDFERYTTQHNIHAVASTSTNTMLSTDAFSKFLAATARR